MDLILRSQFPCSLQVSPYLPTFSHRSFVAHVRLRVPYFLPQHCILKTFDWMFEMYKLKGWIGSIDPNKALESRFETSLLDSKVCHHNLKASSLLFNCCTITAVIYWDTPHCWILGDFSLTCVLAFWIPWEFMSLPVLEIACCKRFLEFIMGHESCQKAWILNILMFCFQEIPLAFLVFYKQFISLKRFPNFDWWAIDTVLYWSPCNEFTTISNSMQQIPSSTWSSQNSYLLW